MVSLVSRTHTLSVLVDRIPAAYAVVNLLHQPVESATRAAKGQIQRGDTSASSQRVQRGK